MSREQMRSETPRYPVDRYLVERSKKMEMVNITDDQTWNPEPAIRPEDELMLRKLHEMLQSTADDLKLISGELMKYREPKVQIKTLPTPLDEEFNEKVHIEEIVNAKFHGHTIIDKTSFKQSQRDGENKNIDPVSAKPGRKSVNASVQVNKTPVSKKNTTKRNLAVSHTKIVQIDPEQPRNNLKGVKGNNAQSHAPSISYNEFSHQYIEPKINIRNQKPLHIQKMPIINIRSELKEQKVLQLDILPEQKDYGEELTTQSNVAVIAVQHEPTPKVEKTSITHYPNVVYSTPRATQPAVRRVSKMLTCESSESTNNVSTDTQDRLITRNVIKSTFKPSTRFDSKGNRASKNKIETERPQHRNLDDWKRKLNAIYGRPSTSRIRKTRPNSKRSPSKSNPKPAENNRSENLLNNAEYIPYTKLTLGGVRVSDIEREMSELPDKNIPLYPILDKILSRENSFHDSPQRKEKNILTTSDENLLEEVLDIEKNISSTLSKNLKEKEKESPSRSSHISNPNGQSDKESYADDFEEERSEKEKSQSQDNKLRNNQTGNHYIHERNVIDHTQTNIHNTTYTKSSNLSFKNSVDTFEFIHLIDTQDNATQSNTTHKISLKATQTSPRTIQPIRNDLWPSENQKLPKDDVDKVLNEDFIKKLIVNECNDILQKNLAKSSTSKDTVNEEKNFTASQKNTQTSPGHVRSVMTSPTKTKTRTTSPFALSRGVDHHTSPIVFTNDEDLHIELDEVDDLAVSINLSSPRFSLRLPQNSRDVLSNLDATSSKFDHNQDKNMNVRKTFRHFSSSSSADGDYSSSDISSLGEINNKFKRRLRKIKIPSISESSASSIISKYSSDISSVILPLRSEGEVSLGPINSKKAISNRSDGELSLGQTMR